MGKNNRLNELVKRSLNLLGKAALPIFLLQPAAAYAAPNIGGVQGEVGNGQNITINGSGFGTGPNVVFFDDFEGGTNGKVIPMGPGRPTIGSYNVSNDSYGSPVYSSANTHSGSLAFRADISKGSVGRSVSLPNGGDRDIFVSYWVLMPSGNNWPGETQNNINWKITWAMGTGSNDDDVTGYTFMGSGSGLGGNDSTLANGVIWLNGGSGLTKGKWQRVWYWIQGRYTSDSYLRLWNMNAGSPVALKASSGPRQLFRTSSGKFERVNINGYTRATSNSYPTFDDVYVAAGPSAQARVEIGNASTYDKCTNLTITTPISWSDTQIKTTVRQGSFKAGQKAYAFVFDRNGNASPGYPVTIGSSSNTPPTTPPDTNEITPPTLRIIQ